MEFGETLACPPSSVPSRFPSRPARRSVNRPKPKTRTRDLLLDKSEKPNGERVQCQRSVQPADCASECVLVCNDKPSYYGSSRRAFPRPSLRRIERDLTQDEKCAAQGPSDAL